MEIGSGRLVGRGFVAPAGSAQQAEVGESQDEEVGVASGHHDAVSEDTDPTRAGALGAGRCDHLPGRDVDKPQTSVAIPEQRAVPSYDSDVFGVDAFELPRGLPVEAGDDGPVGAVNEAALVEDVHGGGIRDRHPVGVAPTLEFGARHAIPQTEGSIAGPGEHAPGCDWGGASDGGLVARE